MRPDNMVHGVASQLPNVALKNLQKYCRLFWAKASISIMELSTTPDLIATRSILLEAISF